MVESLPNHSLQIVLTVQALVRSKSSLNETMVEGNLGLESVNFYIEAVSDVTREAMRTSTRTPVRSKALLTWIENVLLGEPLLSYYATCFRRLIFSDHYDVNTTHIGDDSDIRPLSANFLRDTWFPDDAILCCHRQPNSL